MGIFVSPRGPPSDRFAFGRASERYFWPFVVALMLFLDRRRLCGLRGRPTHLRDHDLRE